MPVKSASKKKVAETEATKVLDAVQGLTLGSVAQEFGDLQVQIQQGLAELSTAISGKVQKLSTVNQAIVLRENRLQELFNIEAAAVSLEEIRQQKEQEAQEAEQERLQRENDWAEEDTERQKKWKRDAEEYAYSTRVSRDRDFETYEADVARTRRLEQIRAEELKREWDSREAELKSREAEITDLRAKDASFDTRVKDQVAKAEAILSNVLKKQYEHEKSLLLKDAETAKIVQVSEVASLKATIAGLQQQVRDLGTQLVDARNDAKEVAQEALKSAGGRQVADALQGAFAGNGSNKTK
jgi:hypothetical protein